MRLSILTCALAILGFAAAPAIAAAPHLGTPQVITSFSGESNLLAASSAAGHPDAYAVFHRIIGANLYTVVHRDSGGHAHRFDIPTARGTFPEAVRLVALESGAGMAIWDESAGHRILARSWQPDGTLGPEQVVLSQVTTVHSADNDSAQWHARADGNGTVVVATTGLAPGAAATVVAAVRDPGGRFGAQQELTPAGETGIDQRQIRIAPIAADGSVAIAWGPEYGDGAGGGAIRAGRAPRFGAPTSAPFAAEHVLSAGSRSVVSDAGELVTISPGLARACPCIRPQVFAWGSTRVLAFQTYASQSSFEDGSWYVAYPDARGVFDRRVKATAAAGSQPVRRLTPGEVGFARFDTETDDNLFRQHARLVVMPFGPKVPRSRRAPRLRFGTTARATARRLLVPLYCDRVCGVHGSSGRVGRLPVTNFLGRRVDDGLEPFSVAYVRVSLRPGRRTVRVSAGASDDAGHRATARATFVRSKRAALWCLAGTKC